MMKGRFSMLWSILFGLVIHIAVAWAPIVFYGNKSDYAAPHINISGILPYTHYPDTIQASTFLSNSLSIKSSGTEALREPLFTPSTVSSMPFETTIAAGWPFRAFTTDVSVDLLGATLPKCKGGWIINWPISELLTKQDLQGVVPYQIIPLTFALNSAIYTLIVWLFVSGPGVFRAYIRNCNHQCLCCGYPRGHTNRCSECGEIFTK